MTEEEATKIARQIGENWTPITAMGLELWWNAALQNTDFDVAVAVVTKLIAEHPKQPKPADFNEAKRQLLRPDGPAVKAINDRAAEERGLPAPVLSKEEQARNVRKMRAIVRGVASKRTDIEKDRPKRRNPR